MKRMCINCENVNRDYEYYGDVHAFYTCGLKNPSVNFRESLLLEYYKKQCEDNDLIDFGDCPGELYTLDYNAKSWNDCPDFVLDPDDSPEWTRYVRFELKRINAMKHPFDPITVQMANDALSLADFLDDQISKTPTEWVDTPTGNAYENLVFDLYQVSEFSMEIPELKFQRVGGMK